MAADLVFHWSGVLKSYRVIACTSLFDSLSPELGQNFGSDEAGPCIYRSLASPKRLRRAYISTCAGPQPRAGSHFLLNFQEARAVTQVHREAFVRSGRPTCANGTAALALSFGNALKESIYWFQRWNLRLW